MSAEIDAALIVARHFDEDAFACDFGGQTAINLPNLGVVIPLSSGKRLVFGDDSPRDWRPLPDPEAGGFREE